MIGPRGPVGHELADDYPRPWRISTCEIEPGLWEACCEFGEPDSERAGSLVCRAGSRFEALESLYDEMRTGSSLRHGLGFEVR